jgi:hypothetical protein
MAPGFGADPQINILPNGQYLLTYSTGVEIDTAVSSDGIHFMSAQLAVPAPPNSSNTDPSVVQLPDGTLLMVVAVNGPTLTNEVFYSSSDGRSWMATGASIPSIGGGGLAVMRDGSIRFFEGAPGVNGAPGGVGDFISTNDGQTWTGEPGLCVTTSGLAGLPSVWQTAPGHYDMVFQTLIDPAGPGIPSNQELSLATSTDGRNFTIVQPDFLVQASSADGITSPLNLYMTSTNDFNGDGTSDVLIQNASGILADWVVQNGTATTGSVIGNPTSYSVVHGIDPIHEALAGDYNGDGTGDILLQDSSGNLVDWMMHNGTLMSGGYIGNPATYGYSVIGTGDFNGDGTSDILLQNAAGNLADWLLGVGGHNLGNPDQYGYHAITTGDFNGKGTTDILLGSSNGTLAEWVMQNGVAVSANVIGNPTAYGFSLIGTGDFNGDGTTDLLLGNSNGTIADWIMQNGQAVSANVIGNPASFGYDVVGTGDYNGDGTADILLQNAAGNLADWTIKNGVGSGANVIGNPAPYGYHLA